MKQDSFSVILAKIKSSHLDFYTGLRSYIYHFRRVLWIGILINQKESEINFVLISQIHTQVEKKVALWQGKASWVDERKIDLDQRTTRKVFFNLN